MFIADYDHPVIPEDIFIEEKEFSSFFRLSLTNKKDIKPVLLFFFLRPTIH